MVNFPVFKGKWKVAASPGYITTEDVRGALMALSTSHNKALIPYSEELVNDIVSAGYAWGLQLPRSNTHVENAFDKFEKHCWNGIEFSRNWKVSSYPIFLFRYSQQEKKMDNTSSTKL